MSFGRDVRSAIFRKVESFSRAELDTFGTASLITRNTNDVQQVQMVVLMGLNMLIIAPILAVGGIILALRQDVPLSAILIVVLPVMAIIVGTLSVLGWQTFGDPRALDPFWIAAPITLAAIVVGSWLGRARPARA